MSGLHLGRTPQDAPLLLDPDDLTTHAVIVGMTGSGKTGLGVIMLEELLARGLPALILDPKGDMGNLALTFPDLAPASFEPWMDPGEAKRAGTTVTDLAEKTATLWREGLARDQTTGEELQNFVDARTVTVYTPGSLAGRPLNILGSLAPPSDPSGEAALAEVDGFVRGLLALLEIDADPLTSREYILLTNLIVDAWSRGQTLDPAKLIVAVQSPPLRKLGVFEIETFYPAADRMKLAMRLNGLLANPSFGPWLSGDPIDYDTLFWDGDKPRAAVVYLSHLTPNERQFVVTLLLQKLISWMHRGSGSTGLRAAVYMDEVFGFCPPTENPPSKKPILTLLKQARAFGIGTILSTQNPVDLDYKALSNAGTWMIGRLQTERDKLRILEGLQTVSGDVDIAELDATITGLAKREFLLKRVKSPRAERFSTRFAKAYLRGPLAKSELSRLPGHVSAQVSESGPAAAGRPSDPSHSAAPKTPAPASSPRRQPAPAQPASAPPVAAKPQPALADDESLLVPAVPDTTPVRFLDPSAPWADDVGAAPGLDRPRLEPALGMTVHLRFDERKAGLDHQEDFEVIVFPLDAALDPQRMLLVDYEPRDFRDRGPEGARYALSKARLDTKTFYKDAARTVRDHLHRVRTLELHHNPELKAYGRPGEGKEEFMARCERLAQDAADEAIAKLHDKTKRKLDSLQKKIATTERQVDQSRARAQSARTNEVVSGVGNVLGMLFGGSSKGVAGRAVRSAGGYSSRRGTSRQAGLRADAAEEKLEDLLDEMERFEAETEDAIAELRQQYADKAALIEALRVGLEKDDIVVDPPFLVWLPVPSPG